MHLQRLLNASSVDVPQRSHHILSSRYDGRDSADTPFITLNLYLAFAQWDSMACVCTLVAGSTKLTRVVHNLMLKAQFLLYLAVGSPFVGVDDGAGSDYFV